MDRTPDYGSEDRSSNLLWGTIARYQALGMDRRQEVPLNNAHSLL